MTKVLQKIRSQKGFTLIELLVVLVIIAILATLAVVLLTSQSEATGAKVARDNLETAARIAAIEYVNNNADFPASATLATNIDNQANFNGGAAATTGAPASPVANRIYVDVTDTGAGDATFYYKADEGALQQIVIAGGQKTGPAVAAP